MQIPRDTRTLGFLPYDQPTTQIVQRFLRRLAVRYVDAGADITHKEAVRLESRHTCVNYPAIFPVITPEPIFHFEVRPCVECPRIDLQTVTQVVWMHARSPAISNFMFHGLTGEIQPGLIEKSAHFICTGHPDEHRSCVSQPPETVFAFLQNV